MDKDRVLGGFEQQVLLTLLRLDRAAYTVPMVAELERVTGKAPSPAAVYTTLRRLQDRGLVSSRYEVPEHAGRQVRLFQLEPAGMQALRDAREVLTRLWEGVEGLDTA